MQERPVGLEELAALLVVLELGEAGVACELVEDAQQGRRASDHLGDIPHLLGFLGHLCVGDPADEVLEDGGVVAVVPLLENQREPTEGAAREPEEPGPEGDVPLVDERDALLRLLDQRVVGHPAELVDRRAVSLGCAVVEVVVRGCPPALDAELGCEHVDAQPEPDQAHR